MSGVHKCQWLMDLLEELEGRIDEARLAELLEKRGRGCIPESMLVKAREAAKDAESDAQFLDNLAKAFPMLQRDADKVYVVYPQCYCHGLEGFEGKISRSYCACSAGWVREMFEQALARTVEVKLESSIIRGDGECRLRVIL